MAMKCCTKLETAKERCPIVFQGHPSNFKVTRYKTLPIVTQIGRFRTIGRSQLSNPSDLPCSIIAYQCYTSGSKFLATLSALPPFDPIPAGEIIIRGTSSEFMSWNDVYNGMKQDKCSGECLIMGLYIEIRIKCLHQKMMAVPLSPKGPVTLWSSFQTWAEWMQANIYHYTNHYIHSHMCVCVCVWWGWGGWGGSTKNVYNFESLI